MKIKVPVLKISKGDKFRTKNGTVYTVEDVGPGFISRLTKEQSGCQQCPAHNPARSTCPVRGKNIVFSKPGLNALIHQSPCSGETEELVPIPKRDKLVFNLLDDQ